MIILAGLITLALGGITLIAVVNTFSLSRLHPGPELPTRPQISLLIPARNETAVIGRAIRSLLCQDYANFEVIVLDDNSTDGTMAAAQAAGHDDPRLRVLSGAALPPGWLGKNWACHQLAQAAHGEWLIFTDADVAWAPGALAAVVAEIQRTQADLLAVWPTQQTVSWGERLVVPLMALAVVGYLPILLTHHTPWPAFAAANGQCLAFRRRAYDRVGGHAAARGQIIEDIFLARRIKAEGLRLRMADGAHLVNCRMYRDWPSVRDGYAKNILAGYGGRVTFLGLATLFHWLVFLAPWLWLGLGWLGRGSPGWPLWPLGLVSLGVAVRVLTARVTGQRLGDALLMPVSVLLMSRIAVQAVWWQWRYGGPRWKDRVIIVEGPGGIYSSPESL